MTLSRRALLGLLLLPGATAVSAASPVRLVYAEGRLSWPGGEARAACGNGGVRADKREGDGASPEGIFPLLYGLLPPGPRRAAAQPGCDDGAVPRARLDR